MTNYSLSHLSDKTLLHDLASLVARDRVITAELLAHMAEVDARRLYLSAGYPSMHAYCEQELRLSESAANKRIRVARKAREVPAVFPAIADGRLSLSGAVVLASALTADNAVELITATAGKTKVQIEEVLAARSPRSETLPMVETFQPSPRSEAAVGEIEIVDSPVTVTALKKELAPGPVRTTPKRSKIEPIARERYDISFSIGQATLDKLNHVRALMSHVIPNGDLAATLDRMLDLTIERLEKRKFGAGSEQRLSSGLSANPRYIPRHVKQQVWRRDGGQCSFVCESGHRCTERNLLEFDHAVPVARGGQPTVENLRLRCRAHNQYAAEQAFGAEFMRQKREAARKTA